MFKNCTAQQVLGSAALGTAVGLALYHRQSPFAQKRRELGRKEETCNDYGVQALSAAAVGYIISQHVKSGSFHLAGPRDSMHIALGLVTLTTILDLPNALAEKRDMQLFTLNRVHDFVVVATIAAIVRQLI